jgi:hypothetical protein
MVNLASLAESIRSLTPRDLAAPATATPAVQPISSIKTLRATHHRLAQLLAAGANPIIAGRLCGFSPDKVRFYVDNDPAFQELLLHYANNEEEVWTDFHRLADDLNFDMLARLRELLDEQPDRFSPSVLLEAIKTLSDRTGRAPVNRNLTLNANVDLSDRMAAARARRMALAQPAPSEQTENVIEGEFTQR